MKYTQLFSINSLIVFGFIIAILPLGVAVMSVADAMREMAALGSEINRQVFGQTKTVGLVLQKTADIERKARLFVLLSDPSLRRPDERAAYETARTSFKQALGELRHDAANNKIALLANVIAEKENLIYQQIVGADADKQPSLPVDQAFSGLREASNAMSREFESQVQLEFNALRQQSESRIRGLLIAAGIWLGLSTLLIAILLALLWRCLRQLDSSIRKLGSGDLSRSIKLAGSADIRDLGAILNSMRMKLLEFETLKQNTPVETSAVRQDNIELAAPFVE